MTIQLAEIPISSAPSTPEARSKPLADVLDVGKTVERCEIRFCRRSQISPDPEQPRKHFDPTKLQELVDSFRQHGFNPSLSHLLVRAIGEYRVRKSSDTIFYIEVSDQKSAVSDGKKWQVVGTADSEEAAAETLDGAREFVLICGERRWLAAGEAGIDLVPYVETAMSDREVLELQLVENLQRAELNPMEEAEAYKRLIEMGATRQSIAEKIALSVKHVDERLSLCRLEGSAAAEAVARGDISPSHGRLLAKVPSAALRQELFEKIMNPPDGSAAPWSRAALEMHIKMNYVRDLRSAKFDREDADLVPVEFVDGSAASLLGSAPSSPEARSKPLADVLDVGGLESSAAATHPPADLSLSGTSAERWEGRLWGGACTDCPFNTAVNPQENRSAKDSSAMCTNPECFRMKEVATHERWQKVMAKEGKFVLSPAGNAELWDESGKRLAHNSPYIELDERPAPSEVRAGLSDDEWRPWEKLIGSAYVPMVLGRDTAGQVHRLALHELAKKAAHLNGHLIFRDSAKEHRVDTEPSSTAARPAPQSDEEHAAETLEAKEARDAKEAVERAALVAIVGAAEGSVRRGMLQLPKEFWGATASTLLDAAESAGFLDAIAGRRDYELDAASFKKLSLGERFGLVVECLVLLSGEAEIWSKVFGVDLARVRKKAAKSMPKPATDKRSTLNAQRSTFNVQVGKGEVRGGALA